MKYVLAIFLALVIDPGKIARVNNAKTEARKAYTSGDYKKALEKYRFLADSMGVREDEVMLNLAHSYFQTNDTAQAISTYQSLIGSGKTEVRSKARQQLGILHHRQGKMEEALADFKQAVKADANNMDARYNYEMLKRKLEDKKKQDEKNNKKKPEPSAYAKKLKAQADALVKQFRFGEASILMNEGAKQDPTVQHYEDFMKRLQDVDQINRPK
ncbi:tetratricopeptide repeat protein [Chryseolinea lacunae]|uniref:Tetratricopeptide repeat protein n=1 Tax=Chryseolinea lacunae TaxID=2801331 RepID=A0ABS1KWJ7_9BACT|nr:tetratricopeptide repeat protein [Chryseolinea lacunae]MBL0743749.1 tetratricopeptide repeat protein [Chryseolinea lacunae]